MRVRALMLGLAVLISAGCESKSNEPVQEVVVYTALDRQFSEPILRDFTARTGIQVQAEYDTEATKTVGLVNRIIAEENRPRCDVFWNNEILNTLRLKGRGLLQPTRPAEAANYPAQFRDPDGLWYGFAARARIIIVNTERVPAEQVPRSVRDLADPRWRGQIGLAKPLFGTTASHVACLFARLGPDDARALLQSFKANNARVVAGNKTLAEMVGAGQLAFGLTDTDDALLEQDAGRPITIVYPDSDAGEMGTLLLPNTLALIKGCPHPAAGHALINYLLSAEVEARLAVGPSGQIPLHSAATQPSRAGTLQNLRRMEVDFAEAAQAFETASEYIQSEFLTP